MDNTNSTPEQVVQEMKAREIEVYDRADKLTIVNENVVVIMRIDLKQASTALITDPRAKSDNIRESWYGKIITVSQMPTGDDIIDEKKKLIKRGDVVSYNPVSAYSLNIAEFEEIWVLHIENILAIDSGYDPILAKEAALKRVYQKEQEMVNAVIKRAEFIENATNLAKAQKIKN